LSAFLNAGLLFWGLWRGGVLLPEPGWFRFLAQVGFATAVMSGCIFYFQPPISFWLAESFIVRLPYMLLICGLGALIYAASIMLVGVKIRELVR
ncbi:MAG: murein biosynthesis integral membrane protein MurJ, partial [Gammaproteobacteria bacterium]